MDSVCSGIIDSSAGVCKAASTLTKALDTLVSPNIMRLHVAQQLRQPIGAVTRFDLQEPSLTVDDTVLQNLTGLATLLRTDRGLLVTLHATATIHERCSRCLADIACPINIDLQEEY